MIIDSRYNVIERLGTGLWATVYKVEDIRTNKIYALKLFHNIETEKLYEKFSAEDMHKISRLKHPNLIHISDFGINGKHIYFLSEFIKGRSLRYYNFKPYHLDFFYDIIVQICYGLNALHMQGIIHKDLKLDNIMYSIKNQKPHIKILDYGFSRVDANKNQQKISGTLPFIAPEILRGGEASPESDFYSLGVILYKITTGSLPFSVEEISNYISGKVNSLFPKFPRELNPDIPVPIEKLILRLLEVYPTNRFNKVSSIMRYINRIQLKKYSFSNLQSIVDQVRFSSYFVREDYAHRLLDYISGTEEQNGKVVVVIGGKGVGKNNLLSLFRYHLLYDRYFLFDYQCSARHQDPFFALIKEFSSFLQNNTRLTGDFQKISARFHKFLYESEDEAITLESDEKELDIDIESAREIIFQLSEVRPLVFIIRAGQYLTDETIRFVNFISNEIRNKRILIIISVNDPGVVQGLIHSVQMKIESLNIDKARNYVETLLQKENIPEEFIFQLWKRTYGNPHFIKESLIDLVSQKLIWDNNQFDFSFDFSKYQLPNHLIQAIYGMMAHLQTSTYRHLQILSVSSVPLSKKMIQFLLNVTEKELFFLVRDAINSEILVEDEGYYLFSYKEAKNRLRNEIPEDTQIKISEQILEFYEVEPINDSLICKGLIENATLAKKFTAIRKYKLKLVEFYSKNFKQDKAFKEIVDVIKLDFSENCKVPDSETKKDLIILREKTELTGSIDDSLELLISIDNIPNFFEKYYIFGVFYSADGEFSKAKKYFEQALELAFTGRAKVETELQLLWTNIRLKDLEAVKVIIENLDEQELDPALQVHFIDRKAVYLSEIGQYLEATNLIEDFLPFVKEQSDTQFLLRLGSLYNNLAYNYSHLKLLDQAAKNFVNAQRIWEKVNNRTALPLVYNNLGDIFLQKGETDKALELFEKSTHIAEKYNQGRGLTLAWLNYAEAYIKIGDFEIAEDYLNKAAQLNELSESKLFDSSIVANKAIIYGKSGSLSRYFNFIKENDQELLQGKLTSLTPLSKTYFYYLYHAGQAKKIKLLLQNNMHMDFIENQLEEFYYQIQALLAISDGDIQNAIENLKVSLEYSSSSAYAQTIINLLMAECYVHLNDVKHATFVWEKALQNADKFNFQYWKSYLYLIKCKIDLMNEEIPLRKILRNLLKISRNVKKKNYTYLIIESTRTLVEVYYELKSIPLAKRYFNELKDFVDKSIESLPSDDKISINRKYRLYSDDLTDFTISTIVPRNLNKREHWGEKLYDLIKLREIDRIKFFIDRYLKEIVSPYRYTIILNDQIANKEDPFLAHNISNSQIYSPNSLRYIEKCLDKSEIIKRIEENKHILYIPLGISSARIGAMIISDNGELPYKTTEITTLKVLRLHLSSILVRIQEFTMTQKQIGLMTKLMKGTHQLFSILDIDKLEVEILSFAVDLTQANRGFLIKPNNDGNYVNRFAVDSLGKPIRTITAISKSVIHESQNTGRPIFTNNAILDNLFKSSLSVQDYSLHSIYCLPLQIDKRVYGFIYLDDYEATNRSFEINDKFMEMFQLQIAIALKNAVQYRNLMEKNYELHKVDQLKNEFLAIVSHELNTPLVYLNGYANRLKRNRFANEEERMKTVLKVEGGVKRILTTTTDIVNLHKYKMANEVKMDKLDVSDILQVIVEEAEILSAKRSMKISYEAEQDLPKALVNWEAFHLMVYNVVLNSIRFTKDAGRITIGVRRSAFQSEELDGKQTLIVYVQDNGKGIPSDELENIFKSFYEVKDIYSHKSGLIEYDSSGLGIGLTTAKRIIELHKGKIWIKSEENIGTTVFLAIPFIDERTQIIQDISDFQEDTND